MPELLTLAQVRQQLWPKGLPAEGGPSNYVNATAQDVINWNNRLNRVVQRYFEIMPAARTYRKVDVPIYGGQFTLPRDVRTALQVVLLNDDEVPCAPQFIYSRFHEFAQCCGDCGPCRPIQPINENAQTFRIPTGTFTLRVTSTQPNGTYQLIGGRDPDGAEYFDSVTLAITNGSATTSREYSKLPRFLKPVTNVACEVYSVDTTSAEATLLAIHAPGETSPAYQRYSAPQWTEDNPAARVLTRLCYVRLIADSDIVIPSSYGAIGLGLQALRYEDVNDTDRANEAWSQGLQLIDSDKGLEDSPSEIPMMRAMPGYGMGGVNNDWLYGPYPPSGWGYGCANCP